MPDAEGHGKVCQLFAVCLLGLHMAKAVIAERFMFAVCVPGGTWQTRSLPCDDIMHMAKA